MDDIRNAMEHLKVDQSPVQRPSLHLLDVPPEIRLRLYSFLFDVNVPIPITIGPERYLEQKVGTVNPFEVQPLKPATPHLYIPLSTQLLRTCRQLLEEATVYLYGVNTFTILDRDTWRFHHLNLSLGTCLCINKLQINLNVGQQPDYDSISKQFPAVPTLEVHVNGPGPALLLAIYELSKVLVNSDMLPTEPVLELCARVPRTAAALRQNEADLSGPACYQLFQLGSRRDKFGEVMRSMSDFNLTKLDDFITRSLLGLGKQVTGFSVIRVHGELHPDYVKAIAEHECSFGDCSFEKLSGHEEKRAGLKAVLYRWKKKGGEPAAIRGKDLSDAAALMRDFVPNLSLKFIEAMQEAGLDTHLLVKGRPSNSPPSMEE